jgi:hypothetical protein
MKKVVTVALALVLALAFAVVAAEHSKMELKVGDQLYVCNCGEKCPCDSMARTVTKVGEGTAVIKIAAAERTFKTVGKFACACGSTCDCGSISQNPGNCVCGKPMAEVKVN